jgi:hypothetical protein
VAGYTPVTFAASEILPEDLGGLVAPDMAKRISIRLMPDVLARMHQAHADTSLPVLAFFDELNNASASVMAACFKLLHEGYAGGAYVPKGTVFVAAGNDAEHSSVAQDLPAPLLNRMAVLNYDGPTFDEWEGYAFGKKVHPAVIGFLQKQSNLLHSEAKFDDGEPTPTPRSWMAVSDFLKYYDANSKTPDGKQKISTVTRMVGIASRVGSSAAAQMEAVLKYADGMVPWAVVRNDPLNAPAPTEFAPSYMMAAMMIAQVGDSNEADAEAAIIYGRRLQQSVLGVLALGLSKRPDGMVLRRAMMKHADVLKSIVGVSSAGRNLSLSAS